MSDQKPGSVGWLDLTVPNAEEVRDFYAKVAGWTPAPIEMDGYSDFVMSAPDGSAVGGVCHARGANADLPPQWIIYIIVSDLAVALENCTQMGGSIVAQPRAAGGGQFAVIRDPGGAVAGLYQA